MFSLVLTAAGLSSRFEEGLKQFALINGHSVLYTALKAFLDTEECDVAVVTYEKNHKEETLAALEGLPALLAEGGDSRQESVRNGLSVLFREHPESSLVAIHDAARPYVTQSVILETVKKAKECRAAVPVAKISDSVVCIGENSSIGSYAEREKLRLVQTPQCFAFPDILNAHLKAAGDGKIYGDDASIWLSYEGAVALTDGDPANIKITYRGDLH